MKIRRQRFGVLAAFSGIALVRAPLASAEFQFKLGHNTAASHPLNVYATEFAAAVRRESNGRLDIHVFPNSQLGADPSMFVQLQEGALEMHLQGLAVIASVAPAANAGFLGFAFRNWQTVRAAMDGNLGGFIREQLGTKGIVSMPKSWPSGFQEVTTSSRAVRIADDFVGLKLRVPLTPTSVELFKALGASPVAVAAVEIYTALQTHLVDACSFPMLDTLAQHLYEVQRFLCQTDHQLTSYFLLINGEKWRSLPPDIQEIVRRNAALYSAQEARSAELQGMAAADLLVRHGLQLNHVDIATDSASLGILLRSLESRSGGESLECLGAIHWQASLAAKDKACSAISRSELSKT